ncbi:MAG TPA: 50S ribosomal protein L11 methyltransferase, partial [Ilumatobacteraceae bacterium]|nr:50S ribosomal protein L11 methyltransferase [Ilumatobacteraceae bacterium]
MVVVPAWLEMAEETAIDGVTAISIEPGATFGLGDHPTTVTTMAAMRRVLRAGDRVRSYLAEVRAESRGPQIFMSRTAPEFMMELFKL